MHMRGERSPSEGLKTVIDKDEGEELISIITLKYTALNTIKWEKGTLKVQMTNPKKLLTVAQLQTQGRSGASHHFRYNTIIRKHNS